MKKPVKAIVWTLAVLLVLLLAVTFGGGAYMVNYALNPDDTGAEAMARYREGLDEKYPLLEEWLDSLEAQGILRDTSITDDQGFLINAFYAAAPQPSRKTAMIVHGYTANPMHMMMIVPERCGSSIISTPMTTSSAK